MWTIEKDPALRSDFCNLTLLDGPPDRARLREVVGRAIEQIPRLGQRVVAAPLRLAAPEWVDADVDLDYHVRWVGLPAPGDERALLDVCERLTATPFDRSRPLWEFTVLEGLADGRAALLQKLHHTITDGVGGLRLSLAIVDLERDTPPAGDPGDPVDRHGPVDPVDRHGPLDGLRAAVADAARAPARVAGEALGAAGHLLAHPAEAPARVRDAGELLASLRRQLPRAPGPRSTVLADRSLRRRFETAVVDLERMRRTARARDATVNDVFVTGIAGAIGAYHERMVSEPPELVMAMPVSHRGRDDDAPNRFATGTFAVPSGPADPAVRLAAIRQRLAPARAERALDVFDAVAGLAVRLPTSVLVALAHSQTRAIDLATSNLRGSPVPLYLAGARIEASYPFGPRTGTAVNATALSYCGRLHVGFNIDPAAVADPGAFLDCVDGAFAALAALGDERGTPTAA